jgi:hypothetical protein
MDMIERAKKWIADSGDDTEELQTAAEIINELLIQFDNYKIVLEQEKRLAEARGISWAERATAEQCIKIIKSKTGMDHITCGRIVTNIKESFGLEI